MKNNLFIYIYDKYYRPKRYTGGTIDFYIADILLILSNRMKLSFWDKIVLLLQNIREIIDIKIKNIDIKIRRYK
jgi:hypothetical protein